LAALHRHYLRLERSYHVRENRDYEHLVVANGNAMEPVHRWFRLKEAFSLRLLSRVLKDLRWRESDEIHLLDPFAGSGTTAVSVGDLIADGSLTSAYVLGYECNPFLHLVGSAKLRGLQSRTATFLPLVKRIAASAARRVVDPAPVPQLTTFANADFFDSGTLDCLLRLRTAVDQAECDGESRLDVDLAKLCLGAIVEPASRLRRDGRALRFVREKTPVDPIAGFVRHAEMLDDDLRQPNLAVRGRIQLGDARTLRPRPPRSESIDLAIFSPPYPNNIDYTEVYKLEAWLLGFVTTKEAFRDLRSRTLYSHPSILRIPDKVDGGPYDDALESLLTPIHAAVPKDRYTGGRAAMMRGYAADMLRTLTACYRAITPGGHLVYVVGNSAHGVGHDSFVVAADLLIAEIATIAGFEVRSIDVARRPRRRRVDSAFLRESVVFAVRPA
jgi:DNA modification methylase